MGDGKYRQKRLSTDEEALLVELFDRGFSDGPMTFGRYLRAKGFITEEDIINARLLQKKQNSKIGEIAVERGLMDIEAVETLLVYQEETGMRFGELAVILGVLSQQQVDDLVRYKEKSYVYFGEALVRLGLLSESSVEENLAVFHRLNIRVKHMDV